MFFIKNYSCVTCCELKLRTKNNITNRGQGCSCLFLQFSPEVQAGWDEFVRTFVHLWDKKIRKGTVGKKRIPARHRGEFMMAPDYFAHLL
jgi:hypothetical protein